MDLWKKVYWPQKTEVFINYIDVQKYMNFVSM